MAGLISTGIWGFICSATMKAGKITATFISGATGWIIRNNGDAEFKSIYARDKFITNEYVYNRIRVTEDEEIISSSIKIASAIDNQDGTWTIYPDLREGDVNPLANSDLLQGYYHSPGDTGVIYAVQRFTSIDDPNTEDQSIIVTCEEGSTPYLHMIIVRVGNESDIDRQSFIKISSRTNCQQFYDEITSFADLDNPDKVKCAIGKADPGLIPAWATSAVGAVRRWFGLIADGVILRGVFILKSSGKTVESELEGIGETITEVETRFEVKEGQISSKVTETKTYAESAHTSAASASDSAGAAEDAKNISVQKASEVTQTAEGFQSTVTEATTKAVTNAVTGATELIEEKVGTTVTQSAKEWKVEVMGSDADGNPNKILAAINASEEGIKISGNKVEITGTLLAQIIMATGLNIGDKFMVTINDGVASVKVDGEINAASGIFTGSIMTPFDVYESVNDIIIDPDGKSGHNFTFRAAYDDYIRINNLFDKKFNGCPINIFVDGEPDNTFQIWTPLNSSTNAFIVPGNKVSGTFKEGNGIKIKTGSLVQLLGFKRYKDDERTYWLITNFDSDCVELLNLE